MNELEDDGRISYKGFMRLGVITMLLLLFGVFGWAAIAEIKGAVIAPGTIVVESKPKIIQHLDGGIVGKIFVKDGDLVEEGETLIQIDPTEIEANREIIESRLHEALARVSRLLAERDEKNRISWPENLLNARDQTSATQAITGQRKLFDTRLKAARGVEEQLTQRVAQNRNQIEGLRSLIRSQTQQFNLVNRELEDLKPALEQGAVSRNRFNTIAREKARLEGEIARNRTEISRLNNAINETEVERLQARRDRQERILQELREAQTEESDLREQLISAVAQKDRIDVLSPVDGVVHAMAVTTLRGVVAPGQEIMQIIPRNDRLIIEAQVEPQDIDQVYEGQPATIRFSAFNQRRTPELNGFVLSASADSLVDQVTGIPYYTVKLTVPPEELELLQGLQLIPGMPAEAFMQTESRSVLSYLLKPATDAMRRSLREE